MTASISSEVTFGQAIVSSKDRLEFCSKAFVFSKGINAFLPKPKKTFAGCNVSFDVSSSPSAAGMAKALALMNNCQCPPIMFSYFDGIYRMHAASGSLNHVHKT